MTIGVLALQGDFALHLDSLRRLGAQGVEVRRSDQLGRCDALVLPGGESTTMLKLLETSDLRDALPRFVESGRPVLATCAGLILIAREVLGPPQPSLGLLDVVVRRNAYGRQLDSFEADAALPGGDGSPFRMVFIRAPQIVEQGEDVETLIEHDGVPVLVRQGSILAAAFHPEMTADTRVHGMLARMAGS